MVAAQKSRGDLESERDSLLKKQAKLQACLNNAPGDRFFASQLDRVGAKLEEIEKLLPPEEKPAQEAVKEVPIADKPQPAPDMDALLKEVEQETPQPFPKDAPLLGAAILREVEAEKIHEEFIEQPDLAELAARTDSAISAAQSMIHEFQKEILATTEQLGPAGKGLADVMKPYMRDEILGRDYKERMDAFQDELKKSNPEAANATWLLGTFMHSQGLFIQEAQRARDEFNLLMAKRQTGLPDQDYEKQMRHILRHLAIGALQLNITGMAIAEESHLNDGDTPQDGRAARINNRFLFDAELLEKGWAPREVYMARLRELMLGNLDNVKLIVAKLNPAAQTAKEGMQQKGDAEDEYVCPMCGGVVFSDTKECGGCGEDFTEEQVGARRVEETDVKCMECGAFHLVDPNEVKTHDGKNSMECIICGNEMEVPNNVLEKAKLAQKNAPIRIAEMKEAARADLKEDELFCPSCSSVISADSDKCPECWTDLSLYVKCDACGFLTPAGEDSCRECFAPISLDEKEQPAQDDATSEKSELINKGPGSRFCISCSKVSKESVCSECGIDTISLGSSHPRPVEENIEDIFQLLANEPAQDDATREKIASMLDDPVKKALSNCPAYVVSNDLALRQAGMVTSPAGHYVIASHDAIPVGSVEPSISAYIPSGTTMKARLYSEHGADAVSVRNEWGHLQLIKPGSYSPVEANQTPVIFIFGTVKPPEVAQSSEKKGMFNGFFSRRAKTEAQPEKAFIMWYLPCVGVDASSLDPANGRNGIADAHGVVFFNLRDLDAMDRTLKHAKTNVERIEAVKSSMTVLAPHVAYQDMRDHLHDPDATLENLYTAFPREIIDFYKAYFLGRERVVVNLD